MGLTGGQLRTQFIDFGQYGGLSGFDEESGWVVLVQRARRRGRV